MNPRVAGRRGGQRRTAAKRAAARKNGARGGRPSRVEALLGRMRAMHERLAKQRLDIDPDDLDLIVEHMCREPNSDRRFFIHPRRDGGYGF
jgi:hypothetical protein